MKLSEIASFLDGELLGDGEVEITGVGGVEEAGPGEMAFLLSESSARLLAGSRASCVVVPPGLRRAEGASISVKDPYSALLKAVELFLPAEIEIPLGVDPRTVVGEKVSLGEDVRIGPLVYIGEGAEIGARTVIHPQVYVGSEAKIGEDSLIYPQVIVRERVVIGSKVVIHPGAVIGSDGFGYESRGVTRRKIPQLGRVVLEDEVEVGANVTVDRATFGTTRIGRGTKVDNLVHIGHNVVIGENCMVVAQVGIGGSAKVGEGVVLAGQAGLADHIEVGDGVKVGAKAGVIKSVPPNTVVSGFPARPHSRQLRAWAAAQKLPEVMRRVKKLEEKLQEP